MKVKVLFATVQSTDHVSSPTDIDLEFCHPHEIDTRCKEKKFDALVLGPAIRSSLEDLNFKNLIETILASTPIVCFGQGFSKIFSEDHLFENGFLFVFTDKLSTHWYAFVHQVIFDRLSVTIDDSNSFTLDHSDDIAA